MCVLLRRGILAAKDHGQLRNSAAMDLATHSGISDISATTPHDMQQGTNRDFGSEWIQRTMQTSKQMHRIEDFRREVARGLF